MTTKKWSSALLILTLAALALLGSITAFIDPFFHYHGPLDGLSYTIDAQRYQNDGILRHFDYDAILTGDSMTENFKTSECDALFGGRSVKTCFNGGTLTELERNLRRALEANPDTRLVICGLDSWHLVEAPDAMRTDAEYPTFLYDNNPLNDAPYLLNKEILVHYAIRTLEDTRRGLPMTSFDDYSSWDAATGRDVVLDVSPRAPLAEEPQAMPPEKRQLISDNLERKVLSLARDYPQVQFLYFFPPYSIARWDMFVRTGTLDCELEAWQLATSMLLEQENIRLFAYYDDHDTINNLDNYRDDVHYLGHINSLILQRMSQGQGRLTKDNYEEYWQSIGAYYSSFDYDALLGD